MTQRRDSVFSDIILNEPGDNSLVPHDKMVKENKRKERLLLILSLLKNELESENELETFN